ncbi:hypothetical protein L6164_028519 [Bauhinia variegata]|uniref:Uncharacterized protein n=1 Tax=Bauhinia variegata TaxID=167791 RepID=A0ACB9L6E6_BAUVA|nr:hypothetical protein L6164_028519 [Bauhinia variegata]
MDAPRSLIKKVIEAQTHTSYGSSSTIMSLPKDLQVHLFSMVAFDSIVDLFNLKICCKDFLDLAEEKCIYQLVSLDTLPLFPWHPDLKDKQSSFLQLCRESGNLEILFRDWLLEFNKNRNSCLQILREISEKGHETAKYMYGMLLLCLEDEEKRKEGLMQLRLLRRSNCVITCRKKVEDLASHCWRVNRKEVVRTRKTLCRNPMECNGRRVYFGWPLLKDEEDDIPCEYCRFDYELNCFCSIFNL